nr:hypothetical protein [uncultured Flavobacterium sp.]
MKKIIILAIASLGILGCSNDNSPETTQGEIDFEVIVESGSLGNSTSSTPQGNIIMNLESWNQVKNELLISEYIDLSTIEVDFNINFVLYVVDKLRPDSSHYIKIENVYEDVNSINVYVVSFSINETASTQPIRPFTIVKIPKTNKPINFVFN